jgi:hypothetical protein
MDLSQLPPPNSSLAASHGACMAAWPQPTNAWEEAGHKRRLLLPLLQFKQLSLPRRRARW